jgi:hypothetical protein
MKLVSCINLVNRVKKVILILLKSIIVGLEDLKALSLRMEKHIQDKYQRKTNEKLLSVILIFITKK